EVGFEHFRKVGQQGGDGVALADAAILQGGGQATATGVGLGPVAAHGTMDHGGIVGINTGGALDEGQRRQGSVVDGGGRQAFLKDGHGTYPVWRFISSCLERMPLSRRHPSGSWNLL